MEDKQLEEALAASLEKSFNDSELEDIMNEIENLEREFSEDASAPKAEAKLSLEKAKDNNLQKIIDDEVASINSEIDTTIEASASFESDEVEEADESFDAEDFENMATESDEIVASQTQDDIMDTVMEQVDSEEEPSVAEMSDETIEITGQADYEDEMHAMEETISADMSEEESNVFAISAPTTSRKATLAQAPVATGSGVEFAASGSMNLNINFNIAGQTANLIIDNGSLKVTLNGVELTIDEANGCCVTMAQGVQFSVPLNLEANANKKKSA